MSHKPLIETFPVELLSKIFLYARPSTTENINSKEAPLNVTHVCRHWRYAALSSPRMWARINLETRKNEATRDRALPTLRAFLKRSRAVKIHFDLDLMCYEKAVDWPLIKTLFLELGNHAERIERLSISADESFLASVSEFLRLGALPALDSMHLDILESTERIIGCDSQFWASIPNVRSLHLGHGGGYDFNSEGVVGGARLQILILDDICINGNDLLRILDGCPALSSLYYAERYNPAGALSLTDNTVRRTFPSITCLQIADEVGNGYNSMCFLLTHAKFPNLRSFVVQSINIPVTLLEGFLLESKPPVEELELAIYLTVNDENLTSVLSKLPGLRRLVIPFRKSFAQQLIVSDVEDEYICPLLEEITMGVEETECDEWAQTWPVVRRMICSRWRPQDAAELKTNVDHTSHSARRLRNVVLPDIMDEDWDMQKDDDFIRKCECEGFPVTLNEENSFRVY